MASLQPVGGTSISKPNNSPNDELEQLALQFNLCIVLITLTLTVFMRFIPAANDSLQNLALFSNLPTSEIGDRASVIALLILLVIGFLFLPALTRRFANQSSNSLLTILATIAIILPISWKWGDPTFDANNGNLWYGWGDKFALSIAIGGVLSTYLFTRYQNYYNPLVSRDLKSILDVGAFSILIIYYLPSIIQPFSGIIDLFHSTVFLNEILIFSSGKMPYVDVAVQYSSLLGMPVKFISFLNGQVIVDSALIWINCLVIFEIGLIAFLARKALKLNSWAIAILLPVAIIFVKVQPNTKEEGGLAQFMSTIPGRTLFPIVSLVLLSALASTKKLKAKLTLSLSLGIFTVFTAFNNIEFGVPAAITTIFILILTNGRVHPVLQIFGLFVAGVFIGFLSIFSIYRFNGSNLTFTSWIYMLKTYGVATRWLVKMPIFGLWVFFFSILGTSAIIGSLKLLQNSRIKTASTEMTRSSILLAFNGIWGSATLFYFSGRSLPPVLTIFLIPIALCTIGFLGMFKDQVIAIGDKSIFRKGIYRSILIPLATLMMLPIVSIYHAPNPAVEWLRMSGDGERWSSRSLKNMDTYADLIEIAGNESRYRFVFLGDNCVAISIMSGVDCGLGVIEMGLLRDFGPIAIKACGPSIESGADFALVPKAEWVDPPSQPPCPGFELTEIDSESSLLKFKIPSKVSP
jgi:hypothetical protein